MQQAVGEKKLAFKRWQSEGTKEVHKQYREKNKQAKRMVAIAKDIAWKYWNESLHSNDEEQIQYVQDSKTNEKRDRNM